MSGVEGSRRTSAYGRWLMTRLGIRLSWHFAAGLKRDSIAGQGGLIDHLTLNKRATSFLWGILPATRRVDCPRIDGGLRMRVSTDR